MVYIDNISENKTMGVEKDEVRLIEDSLRHKWEKGESNNDGYFTLTNPSSQKALTATSAHCLEIKGKNDSHLLLLQSC